MQGIIRKALFTGFQNCNCCMCDLQASKLVHFRTLYCFLCEEHKHHIALKFIKYTVDKHFGEQLYTGPCIILHQPLLLRLRFANSKKHEHYELMLPAAQSILEQGIELAPSHSLQHDINKHIAINKLLHFPSAQFS